MQADEIVFQLISEMTAPDRLDRDGPLTDSGLVAATVYDPPYDGNIIMGPEIESEAGCPDLAIFVTCEPGAEDQKLIGSSKHTYIERADVTIRGEVNQYKQTRDLAELIRAQINKTLEYDPVAWGSILADTLKSSGYYLIQVMEPSATYMGRDEKDRNSYAFSVEIRSVR